MVNAFIKFVQDYRSKNPSLSYKDAMKQAAKVYKKDGKNEAPKEETPKEDSPKKKETPKKKAPPKKKDEKDEPKMDKKTRGKTLTVYKKLLSKVESGVRSGKLDDKEYDDWRKSANMLRGKSSSNSYAKKLKEIEKKLKTKKYASLVKKANKEDLKAKTRADKLKRDLEKADLNKEKSKAKIRKDERRDERKRALRKMKNIDGSRKYTESQINDIIKIEEEGGLSKKETKETTSQIGKYLKEDHEAEFYRINPSLNTPNGKKYYTAQKFYSKDPFNVPKIEDVDLIAKINKPKKPSAPVETLTTAQQKKLDGILDLFSGVDLDDDLDEEFYYDKKVDTMVKINALQKRITSILARPNTSYPMEQRNKLEKIDKLVEDYKSNFNTIRSEAKKTIKSAKDLLADIGKSDKSKDFEKEKDTTPIEVQDALDAAEKARTEKAQRAAKKKKEAEEKAAKARADKAAKAKAKLDAKLAKMSDDEKKKFKAKEEAKKKKEEAARLKREEKERKAKAKADKAAKDKADKEAAKPKPPPAPLPTPTPVSGSLADKIDAYGFDTTNEKNLIIGLASGDVEKMKKSGLKIGTTPKQIRALIQKLNSAVSTGGDVDVTNIISDLVGRLSQITADERLVGFDSGNLPVFGKKKATQTERDKKKEAMKKNGALARVYIRDYQNAEDNKILDEIEIEETGSIQTKMNPSNPTISMSGKDPQSDIKDLETSTGFGGAFDNIWEGLRQVFLGQPTGTGDSELDSIIDDAADVDNLSADTKKALEAGDDDGFIDEYSKDLKVAKLVYKLTREYINKTDKANMDKLHSLNTLSGSKIATEGEGFASKSAKKVGKTLVDIAKPILVDKIKSHMNEMNKHYKLNNNKKALDILGDIKEMVEKLNETNAKSKLIAELKRIKEMLKL